jgi:hypothetical protein
VAFLNAATTDDQAVVDNKLEVANHYTAELGGADTFDKAEAATFIDAVDGTDASVTDAKADIDAAVPASGETFTLTTGVDAGEDFTGGAGDDTFDAAVLTATDGDSIDGGEGADTLNVETVSNITSEFESANIETVNLTALGAVSVDMKNITGVETINNNESVGKVTVNNIASSDVAFGLKGSDTNSLELNYATGALTGSEDTLNVALNGATGSAVDADSGFEAVVVNVTANSTLSSLAAPSATDLTLKGTADLTVGDDVIDSFSDYVVENTGTTKIGDVASVKTFDASNSTGAVTQATTTSTTLTNGMSSKSLDLHSDGGAVTLGAGEDIVGVDTSAVFSTNSTTVKLGAGNDKLTVAAVGSGKNYIFAEAGDDTIYLATALNSTDLVDGGAGNDTLNLAADDYTLIAKSIENVGVEGATTVSLTSADTSMAITDTGTAAVSFSGLLDGSSYTNKASAVNAAGTTLNYKTGEKATLEMDFTKGNTGAITTTNVADLTVTLGAASALAGAITVDAAATALAVNATGALTGAQDIAASGLEKLQTVAITGDKAVTFGDVTNLDSLDSFTMTSAGGDVTVGAFDNSAGTKDQTVTKIEATSTKGGASIASASTIDFTGAAATATGSVDQITASASGATAGTGDAVIGDILADALGTVNATSTSNDASIGDVTVGQDTASTTDGTVTSIKASALRAATIGKVTADDISSVNVESTGTATGGNANLGDGTDAIVSSTAGTVTVKSAKLAANVDDITIGSGTTDVASLGNVTVTAKTSAALGDLSVSNTAGDSATGNISVTGGTTATVGDISVQKVGTISAKAGSTLYLGDVTAADTAGLSMTLDAKTAIEGVSATATVTNTKGDLEAIIKGDGTMSATNAVDFTAGSATATDIDVTIDASNLKGVISATSVQNLAVDADSSITVKGGQAANTFNIDGAAATSKSTIEYFGQADVDTVTLTGEYATSTIYGEGGADVITGGLGVDSIYAGIGADTVIGGIGADVIDLGNDSDADILKVAAADADSKAASMDKVANFTIADDTIDLASATISGADGTFVVASDVGAAAGTTNGIATGMFTFDAAAATSLSDAITKVGADVATAGEAVIFEYDGNTYFFADTDGATTTADDLVIELTGVDSASMTQTSEVFTIA